MLLEWIIVIFLILFGLSLVVAEIIFVPGTTFVGILGFLLTAGGVYMGFTTFGDTTGYWLLAASGIAGIGLIIYGLRSDTWRKFSLESSNQSRFNDEFKHALSVGMTGKTVSELRPYGKALFEDSEYEVRSQGQYMSRGQEVRIAKIEHNTIYVEPLSMYK